MPVFLFFSSLQIIAHPIRNFWANASSTEAVWQHCIWGNQLVCFYWNILILCIAICFNTLLLNKGFVSAQIVPAQGNQLVPKLLLKLSDTLTHWTFTWRSLTPKKSFFDKMTALWTWPFFPVCLCLDSAYTGNSIYSTDILSMCMKRCHAKNYFLAKWLLIKLSHFVWHVHR